jgi:DNA-binding transcriptional ArsR family regulator
LLRIDIGPDDLAATRFAIAPLAELEHLLRKLDRPHSRTTAGLAVRASRWGQRYAPLRNGLEARALRALRPTGWGADFIAPPPSGMANTPEGDLAVVRATPPAVVRAQVRHALDMGGPVDADVRAVLTRGDVAGWLAGALERMWRALVAADWPLLVAIAERDVLHRADRLTRGGWAAALDGLHPGLRWHDGAVVVTGRPDERARLDGRGLVLVPSVFLHPRLATYLEPPWQPTIIYPARGSSALWESRPATPDSLARLLGTSRAELLQQLDSPASTTQLVAATGYALGAVGDHLKVLREAGLVAGTRAGRSVIYRRTPVGDAVVAGAATD